MEGNHDIRYCTQDNSTGKRCGCREYGAVAERSFAHALGISGEVGTRRPLCQLSPEASWFWEVYG